MRTNICGGENFFNIINRITNSPLVPVSVPFPFSAESKNRDNQEITFMDYMGLIDPNILNPQEYLPWIPIDRSEDINKMRLFPVVNHNHPDKIVWIGSAIPFHPKLAELASYEQNLANPRFLSIANSVANNPTDIRNMSNVDSDPRIKIVRIGKRRLFYIVLESPTRNRKTGNNDKTNNRTKNTPSEPQIYVVLKVAVCSAREEPEVLKIVGQMNERVARQKAKK